VDALSSLIEVAPALAQLQRKRCLVLNLKKNRPMKKAFGKAPFGMA